MSWPCRRFHLIPDLQGKATALETVMQGRPDIINYNLETVPHLKILIRTPRLPFPK